MMKLNGFWFQVSIIIPTLRCRQAGQLCSGWCGGNGGGCRWMLRRLRGVSARASPPTGSSRSALLPCSRALLHFQIPELVAAWVLPSAAGGAMPAGSCIVTSRCTASNSHHGGRAWGPCAQAMLGVLELHFPTEDVPFIRGLTDPCSNSRVFTSSPAMRASAVV